MRAPWLDSRARPDTGAPSVVASGVPGGRSACQGPLRGASERGLELQEGEQHSSEGASVYASMALSHGDGDLVGAAAPEAPRIQGPGGASHPQNITTNTSTASGGGSRGAPPRCGGEGAKRRLRSLIQREEIDDALVDSMASGAGGSGKCLPLPVVPCNILIKWLCSGGCVANVERVFAALGNSAIGAVASEVLRWLGPSRAAAGL